MIKKTLVMALAIMLLFSVCVFAETKPSAWAEGEIGTVYPEMFKSWQIDVNYQRPITRAEFAMLAVTVYEEMNGGLPNIQVQDVFDDVGEESVDTFVLLATAVGIVRGVSATEFMPRNLITRQEICTMLTRIFAQLDSAYAADSAQALGAVSKFADNASVADWAKASVEYCVYKGIIKGVSDTEISPLSNVSVEQAMVMCNRIVSK